MEEKIIELARARPALYDTNHPDYFNAKMKQDIWKEIAKNLKLSSATAAKSIWEKLRNNHRDALRRQRAALEGGAPPGSIKKWRYQTQMEFLLQYMNVRPPDFNFEEEQVDDKAQPELELVDEYMMLENLVSQDGKEDDVEIINHSDIPELYAESPPCVPDPDPSDSAKSTLKSNNKKTKKQDKSTVIKQQNEPKIKKKKPLDSPNDEMYYFFLSMYKITKKMPPISQHMVRKKVFEVVSLAEAELLNIGSLHRPYPCVTASYVTGDYHDNGTVKFLPVAP